MSEISILLISDTHCENGKPFPAISEDIYSNIDLIILAGDIGDPYKTREYMDKLPVESLYLAGNHEFYKYSYEKVNSEVFNNTYNCYHNHTVKRKGFNIHLTTLWTYLNPLQEQLYKNNLNDCNWIDGWSPEKHNRENKEAVDWLNDVVEEGDLIFSHHSPSYMSVTNRYKFDILNCCFHNKLEYKVESWKPSLWGHGHIHQNVDYKLFDTRVIANPKGEPHDMNLYKMNKGVINISS